MKTSRVAQVDVVVVSYNSSEHLRRCIEPLAGSERCNVIVVDNASHDGTVETVEDLPVTIVSQDQNHGFAQGCNAGWRLGQADYVLLVNPDSEVQGDALGVLAGVLDRDQHVGVVGPRIVYTDGSLARSQFRFPRVVATLSEALYLHRIWPGESWSSETVSDDRSYEQAHDAEWLSGACLLVRRELLEQVGGLDEAFFMYSEDTELCRAIWALGYSVRFEPGATVMHVGGGSAPRTKLLPTLAASRALYVSRSSSRRVALAFRAALAFEAITHAIVGTGGWATRGGYLRSVRAALSAPMVSPQRSSDRVD